MIFVTTKYLYMLEILCQSKYHILLMITNNNCSSTAKFILAQLNQSNVKKLLVYYFDLHLPKQQGWSISKNLGNAFSQIFYLMSSNTYKLYILENFINPYFILATIWMQELRFHQKTKGASMFPKIRKIEESPLQTKVLGRSKPSKYVPDNIFKAKQDKNTLKLLKLDNFDVTKTKQYQQLQQQFSQHQHKHLQQLQLLAHLSEQKNQQIKNKKSQSNDIKQSIWNLKKELFELNIQLNQEQQQYDKLIGQLGYNQMDFDQQEQYYEAQQQQEGQFSSDNQSANSSKDQFQS